MKQSMETRFLIYLKGFSIYHYGTLIVVILLCSVVIKNCISSNSLKKEGIIVNVKILEYLPPGKSMSEANYLCQFSYQGEIKKLISQSRIRHNKSSYEGQYFPALYSDKYNELRILMKPEDFEEFGLNFPDSLLNRVIDISN